MSDPVIVTVDANVFIAAAVRPEIHYTASRSCLAVLHRKPVVVICPTLLISEIAASISRRTDDPKLAGAVLRRALSLADLRLWPVDGHTAAAAGDLASSQRLRGADAVYLAVARSNGATLVTWDAEMLSRSVGVADVRTPSEWLATR